MNLKERAEIETIRGRLGDYANHDLEAARKRLVQAWRDAYPAAAAEQSTAFTPLLPLPGYRKNLPAEPDEMWFSDVYSVTLRRRPTDYVFGTNGGIIQLGISTHDGTARHDWRDFQKIKNQLAGPECEAFELYPVESRLLDPSNYYSLWCFPGLKRLKVGMDYREVRDADVALAPQRALAK